LLAHDRVESRRRQHRIGRAAVSHVERGLGSFCEPRWGAAIVVESASNCPSRARLNEAAPSGAADPFTNRPPPAQPWDPEGRSGTKRFAAST
jgi:hypothetical protein